MADRRHAANPSSCAGMPIFDVIFVDDQSDTGLHGREHADGKDFFAHGSDAYRLCLYADVQAQG